jgi:hypothetical protein
MIFDEPKTCFEDDPLSIIRKQQQQLDRNSKKQAATRYRVRVAAYKMRKANIEKLFNSLVS